MKRVASGQLDSFRIDRTSTKLPAPPSENECDEKSSTVLQTIIGETDIDSFFRDTFQLIPSNFSIQRNADNSSPELENVYSMGWDGVSLMLHKSQSYLNSAENVDGTFLPLFFRNQEPLQLDEIKATYGNSPFAAFLDGCSIVNNHADLLSPSLAALCLDLQRSFPHAYVNTYLTPPNAAAVNAHADDRDVFVIQVLGEKQWKVYGEVPIPYPSTNEQLGKNNLPVPNSVLQKKPLFNITLKQGDVLYMPRGFVHEASTSSSEPSFHATVALATHDWSLSKTISDVVTQQLESSSKYRLAVHPEFGMRNLELVGMDHKEKLNGLIKDAIDCISSKINVEIISDHLGAKYRAHNQCVEEKRKKLCDDATSQSALNMHSNAVVGPEAAQAVKTNSKVRAGTPEEKASVPPPIATHGRGLTVREDTFDSLISILSILRNENKTVEVGKLRQEIRNSKGVDMLCELTVISFVKCCVELGAMAIVVMD